LHDLWNNISLLNHLVAKMYLRDTSSDTIAGAHSRETLITAVTITFLVTAWLAVLARTWVRAIMIRNYGWDDAVMLLALVCFDTVNNDFDHIR
jgi:hypothetical protein